MYPLTDAEYRFESESKVLRIEKLRAILEKEQGRRVSVKEASQIAEKIVNFYLALAGDVPISETPHEQPVVTAITQKQVLNQLLAAPI